MRGALVAWAVARIATSEPVIACIGDSNTEGDGASDESESFVDFW